MANFRDCFAKALRELRYPAYTVPIEYGPPPFENKI